MRIGHFAPAIWAQGGIATYIRRLGDAQTAKGHNVFYLSRTSTPDRKRATIVVQNDRALFKRAKTLDLDLLHLHKAVQELPSCRVPTIRTMHGNQGSCPSGSRYLKRQGMPCDRQHGLGACLWGHLVDHCGSRRPQQLVTDFQSIQREKHLSGKLLTLTVSNFLRERMIQNGCPQENLRVLHSPAPEPTPEFVPPPSDDKPRFVFLGRIEPKKGVDWLIKAASRTSTPIRLDIAGTGSSNYLNRLRQLVSDLGLTSQVTFHNWLSASEVVSLIKSARAVVVPSVWHEPAGLVTLEAAAAGRPVIASNVGGITEYAIKEFALHTSPRDVEHLANHLAYLAQHHDVAVQMGLNAQHIAAKRYSMDTFLEHLHAHYEQLVYHDSK